MNLPNFLIVGAARAGTTSLNYYLKQHPMVYMHPAKEPNYFAFEGHPLDFRYWGGSPHQYLRNSVTNVSDYQKGFSKAGGCTAVGEASTVYLYWTSAAERIHRYRPDCKIFIILRQPADRAFSHFVDNRRKDREPYSDFSQALAAEPQRRLENWLWTYNYRDVGVYSLQVRRYQDRFGPERVHVFLYEDLCRDPAGVTRTIFGSLGVDEGFRPDVSIVHNPSGIPRHRRAYAPVWKPSWPRSLVKHLMPEAWRRWVVAKANQRLLAKPEFHPEVRRQLIQDYREDILILQDLIARDLSPWLRTP